MGPGAKIEQHQIETKVLDALIAALNSNPRAAASEKLIEQNKTAIKLLEDIKISIQVASPEKSAISLKLSRVAKYLNPAVNSMLVAVFKAALDLP